MISVRRAEPGDAGQLVALAEAVGREGGRWMLATDSWRPVGEERRYLKACRSHPDAAVFVAEEDGRVVARLSLSRDPHPASRHVADLGLMVAASHRRRGVGTALLREAVAWARSAGVVKLELHVFPWNEPAITLYESFGFEREGYRKRHYARDGELVDAILMAYFVDEALAAVRPDDALERPVGAHGTEAAATHAEDEQQAVEEPHPRPRPPQASPDRIETTSPPVTPRG